MNTMTHSGGVLRYSPVDAGRYDTWLILSAVALMAIGLVMVASSSISVSSKLEVSPFYFLIRQLGYLLAGFMLAFITLRIPMKWWYEQSWMLLLIAFVVLVLVLIPGIGKTVNGSTRWIGLGFMNVQSSEISKVCLVLYIAAYLVRRQEEIRTSIWGFVKPLIVFCIMAVLLLMEPDFGALVVTLCALMGMIFLSGVRMMHFLALVGTALVCIGFIAISQQYRLERLTAYTEPFEHKYGAGYQLTQALIAFGRGEWSGVGLGNSIQKLSFLPEAHTDFVFAIIGEEFGVFGSLLVLGLFAVLIWRGFRIARQAEIKRLFFDAYVAYGIVLLLAAQVLINLGVNTGLLPTKGLTLPFLSYGGSSVIMCCVAVGLICRVAYESGGVALPGAQDNE
jgi:cell division protein FtsW